MKRLAILAGIFFTLGCRSSSHLSRKRATDPNNPEHLIELLAETTAHGNSVVFALAWDKLLNLGEMSFTALSKHVDDTRTAWEQLASTANRTTVGEACLYIIRGLVCPYLRRQPLLPDYLPDWGSLSRWWEKSQGKSLLTLRIEALVWTIKKIEDEPEYSTIRETELPGLRERLVMLRTKEKHQGRKMGVDSETSDQGPLTAQIGGPRGRVRSQSEQEEDYPMPDGRVVRADIDKGHAYIDLGSKDGVRNGMRFHIYSDLVGGRRKPKGQVRIIRVANDFSQCSILSMIDESAPFEMGDYIWNKFFDRGRKLTFVFVGKFGGERVQYTREQMKKLVQSAGHIAFDKVTPDAHYAVLGEDYLNDPQYKLVTDWRIDKVTPRNLFDHFGFGDGK